jgi:hypothetical protein
MTTSTAVNPEMEKKKVSFPFWKRTAKPLVQAARTIGYLKSVWNGQYRPAPHAVKMRLLRSWVPDAAGMTLVETGTFLGDTVLALRHAFPRIISIEVDPELHAIAKSRLAGAQNVDLVLGDCVVELPKILKNLHGRAAFWLDGHWSGGVTGRGVVDDPILVSLSQIATHPNKRHILFIDDARTFQGGSSGPDLVDVLSAIREINSDYKIVIHNDIIVATPGGEGS